MKSWMVVKIVPTVSQNGGSWFCWDREEFINGRIADILTREDHEDIKVALKENLKKKSLLKCDL